MEILFLEAACVGLAVTIGLSDPDTFGDVEVLPRHGAATQYMNMYFATYRPDSEEDRAAMAAFANYGSAGLAIVTHEDYLFLAAIDFLRGCDRQNDLPVRYQGRFFLRAQALRFAQIPFFAIFAASTSNADAAARRLAQARLEIARNPAGLFVALCRVAEQYGVMSQLDTAIAKAISLVAGPTIPLAPLRVHAIGAYDHVVATPFLEGGTVLVPSLYLPSILFGIANRQYCGRAQAKRTRSAETIEEPASTKPADEGVDTAATDQVQAFIEQLVTNPIRSLLFTNALYYSTGLTYAATAITCHTVGIEWGTLRQWYGFGAQNSALLIEQFFVSPADNQPAWFVRIACRIVLELAGLTWPGDSLPIMLRSVAPHMPPGIVDRLGPHPAFLLGDPSLILGFLNYVKMIPSIVALTRGRAVGSLAATTAYDVPTGRSREFRLLNYFPGGEWAKDLQDRNSIVYFELIDEVSLFVSVLMKAAREAAAYGEIVPHWLRDGQQILDHLRFEKITLGAGSTTIEARRDFPPAQRPQFTQWIWSRQLRAVSLVSGQYKCNPTTGDRVLWLPYLDLHAVPGGVLARMAPWLECDASGGVTMEATYWYDYRSGQSVSTNYDTNRGLSVFTPRAPVLTNRFTKYF